MGPLGQRPFATLLDGVRDPTPVEIVATVASPNDVTSPLGVLRAALIHVELLELGRDVPGVYDTLGVVVFGDVVVLRDASGAEVRFIARRAALAFAMPRTGGAPLARAPAELVPYLARASGRGTLCYREHAIFTGDTVRLRATVEPASSGSAPASFVVRDDLSPVVLEEFLAAPIR